MLAQKPPARQRYARCHMDDSAQSRELTSLLRQSGVPGAVAVWGDAEGERGSVSWGVTRLGGPAVTPDTRFDLASLTKVVATLPAVLRLLSEGQLAADEPLSTYFS